MLELYARFVLWLLRPALELHIRKTQLQREHEIDETVFKKMSIGNSMIKDGLEYIYGLSRSGR